MRLWHIDLLDVLPRKQLLSQWRECCCIARNIVVNGTPNHLLVNKIMEYPLVDFAKYTELVRDEMISRGYKCDYNKYTKWFPKEYDCEEMLPIFKEWHNDRYLKQCIYNLQEKYDCGGINDNEWSLIKSKYNHIIDLG